MKISWLGLLILVALYQVPLCSLRIFISDPGGMVPSVLNVLCLHCSYQSPAGYNTAEVGRRNTQSCSAWVSTDFKVLIWWLSQGKGFGPIYSQSWAHAQTHYTLFPASGWCIFPELCYWTWWCLYLANLSFSVRSYNDPTYFFQSI